MPPGGPRDGVGVIMRGTQLGADDTVEVGDHQDGIVLKADRLNVFRGKFGSFKIQIG